MEKFITSIKEARQKLKINLTETSQLTGIDQALLSKYEAGKRVPSERHLSLLAKGLGIPFHELQKLVLAEQVAQMLYNVSDWEDVMAVAEPRIEYLKSQNKFVEPNLSIGLQQKLSDLDQLMLQYKSKKPLNTTQVQKLNEYLKVKYTFNSNKIEGNTLSLQETHLVVQEGITIGGKSMREHLEAINHAEAIDYIMDLAQNKIPLDQHTLLGIHQLVLKSIDAEHAGRYRTFGVRISGSVHVPPDAFQLQELMGGYFKNYNKQKKSLHPVILAAEMHERLVSIHPFVDGNGRTSRLIMNLILVQNGWPICILKGDNAARISYYKALEEVQVNNNTEPFYELIIDLCSESIQEWLDVLG